MTAFSFRVSQKKITFNLNDHGSRHRIKAEECLQCKKHYQTGQWQADLMPITPHKGDLPSDVFVLLDTWGQGTIQICLEEIGAYVGFRVAYHTEPKLVGSDLNSRNI